MISEKTRVVRYRESFEDGQQVIVDNVHLETYRFGPEPAAVGEYIRGEDSGRILAAKKSIGKYWQEGRVTELKSVTFYHGSTQYLFKI